ncbi:MAG TPA: porin, partial [Blastocatellia bacterium]|nr:porin [Blastocatellia bacterium]
MFYQKASHIYLLFVITIALLLQSPASAQERDRQDEVEQLKVKVEQLQALIERQRQLMAELLKRVEATEAKTPAVAPSSADAGRVPSVERAALEIAPRPEVEVKAAQNNPKPKKPASGAERSTAFYTSPDGKFEANIKGLGQIDYRGYQSGNHPPNTYAIRRARLAVEGKFMGDYDFQIEGDFADTRGTLLRDF